MGTTWIRGPGGGVTFNGVDIPITNWSIECPKRNPPRLLYRGTAYGTLPPMPNPRNIRRGEQCHFAKLTSDAVWYIRLSSHMQDHTVAELAEMYSVTIRTIRRVINNETWKHM